MNCVDDYSRIFVDYEYLVYSDDFTLCPYYIIQAIPGNYMHLTGVISGLSPFVFYSKCKDKSLVVADFSIERPKQSRKDSIGLVRSKMISLPKMSFFFEKQLYGVEDYRAGKVTCDLAASDHSITIGFVDRNGARPRTLLKGNELYKARKPIVKVSLVLRRPKGTVVFDTVMWSNKNTFQENHPEIHVV